MEQQQDKRSRRSLNEIKVLLEKFDKSNLGAKEFCKTHGISEAGFYKWRARHRSRSSSDQNGFASLNVIPSTASNGASLFAEVKGIKIYQPVTASYLKELSSLWVCELLDSLVFNDFSLFYETKNIDKKFIRFLKKDQVVDFKIVNPTDTFNFTDLKDRHIPDKRLVFGGKSKYGINFIVYEQGGNAKQILALVYKKNKTKKYLFALVRLEKAVKEILELKLQVQKKIILHFEVMLSLSS